RADSAASGASPADCAAVGQACDRCGVRHSRAAVAAGTAAPAAADPAAVGQRHDLPTIRHARAACTTRDGAAAASAGAAADRAFLQEKAGFISTSTTN